MVTVRWRMDSYLLWPSSVAIAGAGADLLNKAAADEDGIALAVGEEASCATLAACTLTGASTDGWMA